MNQTAAGEVLGVAFQQIGKIELGTNRISGGNLYKLAVAYQKPVAWFYEGLDEPAVNGDISTRLLGALHGVDLARDYLAIPSAEQRKALVDLAAVLAVRAHD